jgi:hypothetical protein
MDACFLCSTMFSSNFSVETPSLFNERVVSIHEEPSHHHVLHSNSIRVFDANFPPQQASLYHTHDKDSVLICLEGGHVTNELPGKEVVSRPPIPTGEIYYRAYASNPDYAKATFVHRVRNLSQTPFRILDIEILKEPDSSNTLNPLPNCFNIVLENDRVRVSKLRLDSTQSTGEIEFKSPRLLAFMGEGKISITSVSQSRIIDADRGSLDMQELSHKETITNVGASFMEIVIIEIK